MKRALSLLLTGILLISIIAAYISAAEIAQNQPLLSPDSEKTADTSPDGSGEGKRKVYTIYNTCGEPLWKATLTGTFTYDGTGSACTSSGCSITIYHDRWEILSREVTRSGGSTTVRLTMGYKFLGITLLRKSIQMTLTCDKNGNFS